MVRRFIIKSIALVLASSVVSTRGYLSKGPEGQQLMDGRVPQKSDSIRQVPFEVMSIAEITSVTLKARGSVLDRILRPDDCYQTTEQLVRSLASDAKVNIICDSSQFHGLSGKESSAVTAKARLLFR